MGSVILILVLLITLFCYANIIYKVNSISQSLLNDEDDDDAIKRQERIRARVSKKISGYILIFICQ